MSVSTDASIDLGRLHGGERTGPRHRLLHPRDRDIVIMPYLKTKPGWDCVLVASRTPIENHHVPMTAAELAHGFGRLHLEPERDPDGYARLAWISQAFRHWPGGTMLAFARLIVDELRIMSSRWVPDHALNDHGAIAPRLPTGRPQVVAQFLDQLIDAGLIARASHNLWQLTLPEPRRGE